VGATALGRIVPDLGAEIRVIGNLRVLRIIHGQIRIGGGGGDQQEQFRFVGQARGGKAGMGGEPAQG